MDRNEGIIRWSPNPSRDDFMVFNLNNRMVQLYEATGHAQPGHFDYERLSKHTEFPAITTYDWSPEIRGLVAVGTHHGEVQLLRVDDNSNAVLMLPLKLQRSCQSVAFNTSGLLAVGLDRVRNDSCLHIWDIHQRLPDWDPTKKGWNISNVNLEPKKKLEASVSITSIRFFEDHPQTLVLGTKNQSVRVHDLRDPNGTVINFPTRCCNNIAIDYTDTNYFASSTLDQPGLVVWDRRVSSRATASHHYLESFDQEEVPWGAALDLKFAIASEKNSYIKQLRYSRERRGALGVLSSAGQLQVLQTKKEFEEPGSPNYISGSPQLIEVRKSYDLEYPIFDSNHQRKHRIVSFDWLNLGSAELPARVVALRANGNFEVLQMPADSANHFSQMVSWTPPHRIGDPYMTLMNFEEEAEQEDVLDTLIATAASADIPIFGPGRHIREKSITESDPRPKTAIRFRGDLLIDLLAPKESDMSQRTNDNNLSPGKLADEILKIHLEATSNNADSATQPFGDEQIHSDTVYSSKNLHEISHYTTLRRASSTKFQNEILDTVMLRRAEERYLFNCKINKSIVADDRWLQDVWEWIGGAEDAARDDGMVAGPLDLSYMGVYTIWMNQLGEKSQSRLIESTVIPDASQWERLIAGINKSAGRPHFDGISTSKPHHRQLCLAICGCGKPSAELEEDLKTLTQDQKYTTAAAWALFEGIPKRAVEILKMGGTELLFVAMALDIKLHSGASIDVDTSTWDQALKNHPRMAKDPYLRAIYGYITTGDWAIIAGEISLPLRDRVGVALRNFDDDKLTGWLSAQMEEASRTGDIEGIVLSGITDNLVDIFAKFIEKFMDFQTPALIMSFCYPRYINDIRCDSWRKAYQAFLQRHKKFVLRVNFERQSTVMSRTRDGTAVIKPPPRQVTIRCLNCDANAANDLRNSGASPSSAFHNSSTTVDPRNPLAVTGINAGLSCPRCGSHLSRCAVCMEIVGVPRSDRPEQSTNPEIRRMANFPSFCLKCRHVQHMDHSVAWFKRHNECPVPECHCQCNSDIRRWEID